MEKLSIIQVAELLKKEGFSEDVVDIFTDNAIDGKALKMLTSHEHMKELGLKRMGDRLKLENLISNYEEAADAEELPPAEPPAEIIEMPSLPQEVPASIDVTSYGVIDQTPEGNGELVSSVTRQPRKSVHQYTLKFNTIVSGLCWGWDNTSQLYICLSPPELGGIESCHRLESQLVGNTAAGHLYFKGGLKIPYHIIAKYTYIYYIYAAKTGRTGGSIVPEHIWNVSTKKSVYRCIEISSLQPGGVWEQWDTIVYPREAETPNGVKVAPEGLLDFLAQKVVQNLSSDDDTSRQQITDDPEDQELADERCLYIYLQAHQKRLVHCADLSSSAGISEIVDTIQKIWDQLQTRTFGLLSTSGHGDRTYFTRTKWNSSQRLAAVMGQWVMSIVKRLQTTRLEQWSIDARKKCLVSAIAVLCIAHETITLAQLSEQNCVRMSNLLRESYRPEQKECAACILEDRISTDQFRDHVVKPALKSLALTILQKSSDKNWRWLQVVPLFHFMSGLSCPFKAVPLNEEIKWNFWVELLNARKKQSHESYTEALVYVEDLLELDYQFAKVMLFLCPHKELVVILQKVDPILSTSFYTWYVKNFGREYIIKAKDPEELHHHLRAIYIAHMYMYVKESDDDWRRKLILFTNQAHELMKALMEELTGISESHCEILYHITHHVLSIMSLEVSKKHGDLDEYDKPSKVVETIGQWLQSKAGVDHVKFGGLQLKKFDEEVFVWRVLCRDTICPHTNIKEHWNKAIEHLLVKRAKTVTDKAELVLHSYQKKLDTPELVKITFIRLYVAIDDTSMSPNFPKNELSQRICKLAGLQRQSSSDVSKLLSKILTKHFEKENQVKEKDMLRQRLTIDELASWQVWPIMMKIACDEQSALFCNMTEEAKEICMSARNVLQITCNQIVTGDIAMDELKLTSKNKSKVQFLCTEAAIKDFNLEKWLHHLEAVVAYIGRVQVFHNLINLGVKDYKALQKELQEASVKSMAELCSNWSIDTASADLKFTCCPTIEPCTQAILTPFYHLAVSSEIFCRVWKRKLCTALMSHCGASQEDIVKFVWRPTLKECWTFLNKLKSRRILLSELKELLYEQDIQQSCRALMSFLPPLDAVDISLDEEDSMESIDTVCEQVKCYYLSLKCIDCAQAVFRLQDKLEMKGDFSHMQILGDKESNRLAKLSLGEFTDLLQDDVKMLHRITDPSKVNFLKSLENNWTLVKWIKGFKSVKEFQDFVDLALDTFDTTDMTVTMLTVLRIVGSVIGRFLFSLPNPHGLNELVTTCNDFWSEGSFDHRLLRYCGKNLNHFKTIKDRLMCLAESANLKEEPIEESQVSDDESAVRSLLQVKTPRKLEDDVDNTEVSEICQTQQVLQLKYSKLEEAVEKLSTVNMSLREENSKLNCLLQTLQDEVETLNGTLNRERAEHQDQTVVMNQKNEKMETTIVEQRQELNQMMSELHTLQQECNELKQSLDQAAVVAHGHEQKIAELTDELSQANTETEHFKDCYHTEKNERQRVEEELQTSIEVRTMLESQLEARNTELDAKNAELRELNRHLTTQMASDLRKLQIANDVQGLNIAEKKGAGSYGAVYEVQVNGVPCIAKRLHDILVGRGENEPVGDEEMRGAVKQFNQECVLLSRLRHPNIVQFMGVHSGDHEADVSLIMEYMHMDLEHCINTYPNIPLPYKTSILRDVTYGLAYLHSSNIIHRDLNTGNILLTQSLQAKIADVGMSKVFDRKIAMLRTRTKCPGASDFMPPEALVRSPKYDEKLDVFSFGHLTLCLINQESPNLNDSTIIEDDVSKKQIQVGKRREALERMGSRHPLHSIVVQCLSDIPEQRPTSRELVTRMERICQQHPIPHKNFLEVVAANQ